MKCRKSTKPTHRAPKNDPKTTPRRPKKRSRTTRRKKDRTKTILGPSWTPPGPICIAQPCPRGSILEAKTAPKSIRKRSKIEAKNQDEKNRSKTILDPSWGDLGPSWVPSWADLDLKIVLSPSVALVFSKNHFFDVKTDKTKKGPNQDDLGTVLDPPRADLHSSAVPPGLHFGGQNGTKIDPKTIKNRSEKSRRKKPIQDDLGPVLGRSWAVLGAILGRLGPRNRALALGGARFFEKSLFRC